MPPLFAFGSLGTTELIIIAGVALLIFGNRLPSVMRSLGKSVIEFKKGVAGDDDDLNNSMSDQKKTVADAPMTADKK